MNNTRMQKKQYRLSLCLKAVIIAMIGLLIAFFGVITYYTHNDVILSASIFAQNCKSYGPFIYITAILSFIILKIGAIVSCGAQLFVAAILGHKGLINFKA